MSNKYENKNAFRIAAYFAVIGLLWIYGSDYIVEFTLKELHNQRLLQSLKGTFFVITVSVIIYFLVRDLLLEIKVNNQAVITSEKRLKGTLDNLIEGCQIINFDWKYSYLNNVAVKHIRKPKSEILDKSMMDVFPGIESNGLFHHLRNCLENRISYKTQYRVTYDNENYAWFEINVEPVPEGILILSYDITRRKEAQQSLQNSKERLIEAQRIAMLGDFKWYPKTGKVSWSEALYELLGYNKSDCIDYELVNEEIHHPDDLELVSDWLLSAVQNKCIALEPLEYRVFKKDKSIIYVRTRGVVDYSNPESPVIFATLQDITQIKNYIHEIEEKNEFIQTVLNNLPIGITLNKFDEGTATYMNKKFSEIYGWPEEELTDVANFFQKVYPEKDYREKIVNQVTKDLNSGDPSRMHWEDIVITQKNGDKRIINAVNIPLFDQNTMVSTVMDYTELKKYQQEIILAMEKARESDRLKSAFLANMSHEIRTPLNGIVGFSDIMLSAENMSAETKKKYARIIKGCSDGLLQIVNDILDISSLESGNFQLIPKQFDLNIFLESIYALFNNKLKEKNSSCQLRLTENKRQLLLCTDEDRLRQIFFNLLDNAIKFTDNGEVEFGIERIEENDITFFVRDTGIGIPKKYHELIFNRFRQSEKTDNKAYGGNGLGLSIVKELLRLMQGEIWIESEVNNGTTFYFRLPYDSSIITNETQHSPLKDYSINGSKLNVLIVEDDLVNTLFLKEILLDINTDIIETSRGLEAIDIAKSQTFDVILMDIRLPDINGLEVVKEIRKFNNKVYIIAQTAYAMVNDQHEAILAGCNAYISKPIKKELLYEKISTIWR